ncbi:MAG: hypothetical protein ABI330_01695 [Caldimonas sp.]
MAPHRLLFGSPRRYAWLLWFALLLPVAQAAAACHAFTHLRETPSSESGAKQGLHSSHCDICLMGAAIAGAAPSGEPASFESPTFGHEVPHTESANAAPAFEILAYLSRAPPLASL